MGRGGSNGARVVVVEGEVHVEGAEKKLDELAKNGIPPRTTAVTTCGGGGGVPSSLTTLGVATAADGKAVPDVNELAAAFIRRSKERFQGIGVRNDNGQN